MTAVSRRAENTEATRRAVFDAAKAVFVEQGYADASLDDIAQRARVTKGALYYHFKDKRDLFRAVVEELNGELARRIGERVAGGKDAWHCVVKGTEAFLDFCLDPAYQRIILLDGPSVLGREDWRDLADRHGRGILRAVLAQAMEDRSIPRQPVEPLAHLLHGALHEGALHIATARDVKRARKEVGSAVLHLMEGLRAPSASQRRKR